MRCRLHTHNTPYPPAAPCPICRDGATRLMTCACCGATGLVPPCDHRTAPADVDEPMPGSPMAGGPPMCWRCAADCPSVTVEPEFVEMELF